MLLTTDTPPALHITKTEDSESPSVTFDVVYDQMTNTYRTVNLVIGTMFKPLKVKDIRAIKLGTLRKELLRKALLEKNPGGIIKNPYARAFLSGRINRRPAASKLKKPTPELYEQINDVLALAQLTGDYPIKSVRQTFVLSRDEAAVLVRQARKMLPTAE